MKKVVLTILACAAVLAGCKKETVMVQAINLDKTTASVVAGETLQLKATVLPDEAENPEIEWTSDKTEIATVDKSGVVTGVAVGTAKITAAATDGSGVKASCNVTVTAKALLVTKIDLQYTSYTLKVGETLENPAAITPEDATNTDVIYTSDKPDVASVDENGLITAKTAGTANIKATATDGSAIESEPCVITVIEPKPMFFRYKKILMRVGLKNVVQELYYGSVTDFANREECENAEWTITSDVVTMSGSNEKRTLVATTPGTATLKAVDPDGNEIECEVTVLAAADKNYDYNYGVVVDDCNSAAGWISGYHKVDGAKVFDEVVNETEHVSGTGSIAVNGNTGYCLFAKTFESSVDASSVQNPALYLRLYVSDPTQFAYTADGQIELCSGGNMDTEELTFLFSQLKSDKFELKSGWNNIVLPFSMAAANGGFRANHINYFRLYQSPSAIVSGLTLRIDQIRIVDWTEFDTCDNFDMWYEKAIPENIACYEFDTTDPGKQGAGCIAVVDNVVNGTWSNYRLVMWPGREYAFPVDMDESNAAVQFKFFVSDAAAFTSGVKALRVEMASNGVNDANNFDWSVLTTNLNLVDGWNTITLNFSEAGGNTAGRTVRKLNYFRLMLNEPTFFYGTYKLDDIRIVKK